MNESYDAITVRPMDSSIGVNISVEKAFAAYENGTPISEIAEHFADAVEKGFRESPQVDLESISDYEQMKSKLSMEVVPQALTIWGAEGIGMLKEVLVRI